jgi:hypothetical protein
MPTEFIGQNGAEIHTSTKIDVTGCSKKARQAKHRKKPTHRKHKQHKR